MNLVALVPVVIQLMQAAGVTYQQFTANQGKDLDPEVLDMIKRGYDERIAARELEQERLDDLGSN